MTTYGLHIDGATFPLVSSKFGGHLVDPVRHARHYGDVPLRLHWDLSLRFGASRLNHEDAWEIEPIFQTHEGFDPGIADWRDFSGKTARWHDARRSGAPVGNAYVYEHADIYEAALEFSARDGRRFEVQWFGLCNVYATPLWERVPFRIAAQITFEAITVECRAGESMSDVWRRLAAFCRYQRIVPTRSENASNQWRDRARTVPSKTLHAILEDCSDRRAAAAAARRPAAPNIGFRGSGHREDRSVSKLAFTKRLNMSRPSSWSIALVLLMGGNILAPATVPLMASKALAQDSRPVESKGMAARKEHRMDLNAFWRIIGQVRSASRDDQDFLRRVGARLDTLKPEELVEFQRHFLKMRAQSYSWELWGAAWLINDGCADDCFDYFRAWLISRGQQTFEKALEDPDALASLAAPKRGVIRSFEGFLQMPGDTYETKTGEEILDTAYEEQLLPKLDNRWDFKDTTEMRKRYPKLFAKYGRR